MRIVHMYILVDNIHLVHTARDKLISTDCLKFLSRFVKRRVFHGILMKILVC